MRMQVDVFSSSQSPLVLTYGENGFETCGELCLGLACAVPSLLGVATVTHDWVDPGNVAQQDVQIISLSGAQPPFLTKVPVWMKADSAAELTITVAISGGGSVKVSRCSDF